MEKIRGLEKFCLQSDDIAQDIDIRVEIAKWRRENGKDPIIIIDVKELNRFLCDKNSFQSEALYLGGQFWKFNEILKFFFSEMKKAKANLVFIVRLDEGRYKDLNKWKKSTLHPQERLLYNLLHICSKYGEVSMNYGLGKRSILSYARQNRDKVMALITRDASYLVYDIDFLYWNLSDVVFEEMKIVKICQKQMLQALKVNTKQMQLILAIYMINFDLLSKFQFVSKKWSRFKRVVEYVKPLKFGENGFNLKRRTRHLSQDQRNNFDDELNYVFAVNNYAGSWNEDSYDGTIKDLFKTDESFESMLLFYKKNIYFAYKLINEKDSSQKDLLCIGDGNYSKLIVKIILKMIGILFKDVALMKRPKTRTVQEMIVRNTCYEASRMDIIYPPMPLPSLKDLIIEEVDKSFDAPRWSLLTWLLDLDPMTVFNVRFLKESKFIRIVSLTLKFLEEHKLIPEREAKIILQIEKDLDKKQLQLSQSSSISLTINPYFHKVSCAWAETAHKYTTAYKLICHCYEVSGLRKETALIMFDGLEFNASMKTESRRIVYDNNQNDYNW